jgi:hypothetical protein
MLVCQYILLMLVALPSNVSLVCSYCSLIIQSAETLWTHAYTTISSCYMYTLQDTETRSALLCEASAVVDFAALCLRGGDTINSSSRINSAIAQACYAVSCSTQRYYYC